jgi:predicted SnoaL-like aldol condensation-catalyzing enzyme
LRGPSGHRDHRLVPSVSELNKHKVRRFVEDVWNEGRLELIDELVAADYLGRFSWIAAGVVGREGVHELVSSGRQAHPGLYVKIEDQIAEDDLVVMRWRATEDAVSARCSGISVVRLLAGRLVDSHTATTTSTTHLAA